MAEKRMSPPEAQSQGMTEEDVRLLETVDWKLVADGNPRSVGTSNDHQKEDGQMRQKTEAQRLEELEKEIEYLRRINQILFEFCRSVANKEGMSLLSYQQLHSPSAHSCQKVRVLFEEIRKLG